MVLKHTDSLFFFCAATLTSPPMQRAPSTTSPRSQERNRSKPPGARAEWPSREEGGPSQRAKPSQPMPRARLGHQGHSATRPESPRNSRVPPGHGQVKQRLGARISPSPKKRRERPIDGAVRSVVKVRAEAREGVEPTVTTLVRAVRVFGSRGTQSSNLQTPLPQEAAAPCNVARVAPRRERRGQSCMRAPNPADPSWEAVP